MTLDMPSNETPSVERANFYHHETATSTSMATVTATATAMPSIAVDEPFPDVVRKISYFLTETIDGPHTFEQLRTSSSVGRSLRPFVTYLAESVQHPGIVAALLALKCQFDALEPDDRGVNETRGLACELVAWRFLAHLSELEIVDYLLYELPAATPPNNPDDVEAGHIRENRRSEEPNESTSLIESTHKKRHSRTLSSVHRRIQHDYDEDDQEPANSFIGLNALEIAAVAGAKRFLSQRLVQKIVNGIWRGDIVFWESLGVYSEKKARFYNKKEADPYCRLRVPRYQKAFEVLFFATFLALYYSVLVERNPRRITPVEVLLYIWIAAFAYDEFSEFRDAGTLFYSTDFWSTWDIGIIAIGAAYLIARIIGLAKDSGRIIDASFDILSLEALFLVPRICSLLSLHPYFGTLIPCLKEMTKDFIKFLGIVVILYLGFLTTFTLLARDSFTLSQMSWILIKVFFGSSYLGFDAMREISPVLGPPLMLIFVCMTNILLITSLISLLSNSLTKVMDHAREEYLFIYSVFVLEASTSNRLTYFYPPLNLIPLILLRPLRLFFRADQLRQSRIILLKVTHSGYLLAILVFERWHRLIYGEELSLYESESRRKRPLHNSRRPQTAPTTPSASATVWDAQSTLPERNARNQSRDINEAIAQLSAQVTELKAIIVSHQNGRHRS